jgi:hypothetical protein
VWLWKSKGERLGKKSVIKGKKHYGGTRQDVAAEERCVYTGGRGRNVIVRNV